MSVIDRDRWRVLAPLLDEALELSDADRSSWLDDLRSSAPSLAAELTSLLSSESAAERDQFLAEPRPLPLAGLELGPWTLERPIGHGGMGSVWLARRTDGRFEGQAAVKFLNFALLTPRGEERFRREGSMLARLSHVGIARLFDAGVASAGQPYLVLEHIEGQRIDAFADERCLTIADRIRLVRQVLSAVAHAQANLIVHRDIKPSNILVTADGTAKLLDFGIATLLGSEAGEERTALTGEGRALTPEYAAPEQLRGEAITAGTDVYAIGVLLYILLTGRHPFDVAGRSAAEIERIVSDIDPPKPSACFVPGSDDLDNRARVRGAAPERLRRRLRGDLDAVLLKALHTDPARRYATAAAFADDLDRILDGRPVLARPDRSGYRVRRFIGRHRLRVAVAAIGGVLLAGYVVTVIMQREQIQRALGESMLSTQRAEQVTDFMMGLFEAAEGGRVLTDTVTARDLLSRGVAQAQQISAQPALQAQMLDVIGRLYTELGEYDRARPLVEEALAIRRQLYGEDHPDVATSLESLASVVDLKQDVTTAVTLRRQALELRRRVSGPDHPKTIDALYYLAFALHRARSDSVAWPLFEEWLAATEHQPREVTGRRATQLEAAGAIAEQRGQVNRAESMFRESLAIRRDLYGPRHPLVAVAFGQLGDALDQLGRKAQADTMHREAVAILREAYPDGHPLLAGELRAWAFFLQRLGRFPESVEPLREVLALRQRFTGEQSIDVAVARLDVAHALTGVAQARDAGAPSREAEGLARQAEQTLVALLGRDNAMVVWARVILGDALRSQGRLAEAEPLLVAGYERFKVPRPFTISWRGNAIAALARLREAQGRTEEARELRAMIGRRPGDSRPS
jgi:serine/threonine-protein kinase